MVVLPPKIVPPTSLLITNPEILLPGVVITFSSVVYISCLLSVVCSRSFADGLLRYYSLMWSVEMHL